MEESPLTHLAQICSSIGIDPKPVPPTSNHNSRNNNTSSNNISGNNNNNNNNNSINSNSDSLSHEYNLSGKHAQLQRVCFNQRQSALHNSASNRSVMTSNSGKHNNNNNNNTSRNSSISSASSNLIDQQHLNGRHIGDLTTLTNHNTTPSPSSVTPTSNGNIQVAQNILNNNTLVDSSLSPKSVKNHPNHLTANDPAANNLLAGNAIFNQQQRNYLNQYQNYYAQQQQQHHQQQQQQQLQQQIQQMLSSAGNLTLANQQYNQLIAEAQQQQFTNLLLAYQQHQRHMQAAVGHPSYCLCPACLYMKSVVFR